MTSNDLSPSGFDIFLLNIKDNKKIVKLDFKSRMGQFRNKITNSIVFKQYLMQNNVLQILCLSRCSLQLRGLQYVLQGIIHNNTLVRLDISNNYLGPKSCNLLNQYMKKSNLEELNLYKNNIQNQGIHELVILFINNPHFLKSLNIGSNQITTEGLKHLLDQLIFNESMQKLTLDENNLHDKDIFQVLSVYIQQNQTIQELSIQKSDLCIYEMQNFVEALSNNKSLVYLNLNNNELQDYGAIHLAQSLTDNKDLKYLHIQNCKIQDEGGIQIAKSIITHPKLKNLDIRYNILKDDAGLEIFKAIKLNKQIKKIFTDKNLISYKIQLNIQQQSQINKNNYIKNRPLLINQEFKFLQDFEQQKYSQYQQQEQLKKAKKKEQELLNCQQKQYDSENESQQNEEENQNQIYQNLFTLGCKVQKTLKDTDLQQNDDFYQLNKQKDLIEQETSKINQKINQLSSLKNQKQHQKLEIAIKHDLILEKNKLILKEQENIYNNLITENNSYKNQNIRLQQRINNNQAIIDKQQHISNQQIKRSQKQQVFRN